MIAINRSSTSDSGAEYCDDCVCVCMCLSVCRKSHSIFTNFLCMLPIVVDQSSSGSVAIRYILPVSGFMDDVKGNF